MRLPHTTPHPSVHSQHLGKQSRQPAGLKDQSLRTVALGGRKLLNVPSKHISGLREEGFFLENSSSLA